MNTSRRIFLTGASVIAVNLLAKAAFAQDVTQTDTVSPDVIGDILKSNRRGNWSDDFDAQASQGDKVASKLPIFSPQTVTYVEQAIAQHSQIVAQGGWPIVPATKKLKLGKIDPDVEALRKRLMVSGDLSPRAGISQSFDTYVDAAVKRFQTRHGLPADGVMGTYTYAALNISAPVRLGQLETNLVRLRSMSGFLGDRYVMVNIPAAQIEAVENDRVVLRHTAIVGKIDRQTPIVNSKINEIIVNPYWNAPESIVRKDIIPLMRKDPEYLSKNNIHILGPDGLEIDPTTIDWNTEDAAKFHLRQDPGQATPWRRSRSTSQPRRRLYARYAAAEPVLEADALRFVGLRARPERTRPRHLAAARHAGLDPAAIRGDDQERRQHAGRAFRAGAGLLHLCLGLVDGRRRRALPRRHLRPRRRRRTADIVDLAVGSGIIERRGPLIRAAFFCIDLSG